MDIELQNNEILVLRTCREDMTSRNGFRWPESGPVEATDWSPDYWCGGGLHGLPWGEGDVGHEYPEPARWLVVQVSTDPDNYRYGKGALTDQCKFRRGEVVYCGDRDGAVALIQRYAPAGTRINWARQFGGDYSTQTAGDYSTQTAGDESTQTAGDESTQTAGYYSTQTAGYRSTQTAGCRSTQTAGYRSTQTAGDASYQRGGVGTVQITRWWQNGKHRVATRVIGPDEADRWYYVKDGVWRPATEDEVAKLEKRLNERSE